MAFLLQWLICSQASSTHSNSLRLEHLHQLPSSPGQSFLSRWGSHKHHLNMLHLVCVHCEPRSSVHQAPSSNRQASPFPSWLTRLNSSFTENTHIYEKGNEESDSSLIPLSRFFSYIICFSETWLFPFKETMQLRTWMCRPARTPSHLTLRCLSFLMGEIEPSLVHRLILQDDTHCIHKAFRG